MPNSTHDLDSVDIFQNHDTDKFEGIRYYAVSSDERIIAVSTTPEGAYFKAVSKGVFSPTIFSSKVGIPIPHDD